MRPLSTEFGWAKVQRHRAGVVVTAGWDVLLHGDQLSAGRMDVGGISVHGTVRRHEGQGVGVVCTVLGDERHGDGHAAAAITGNWYEKIA